MNPTIHTAESSNAVALPQDVEHKFGKYGRVKEVRIVRNPATGESRGFGFVGMSEEHEVDAVRVARLLCCTRGHMQSCVPFGGMHIALSTSHGEACASCLSASCEWAHGLCE